MIKENISNNGQQRMSRQRSGLRGKANTEFQRKMSNQKKEMVLPTQFNFPNKFYSPNGDPRKQNHNLRKVPK